MRIFSVPGWHRRTVDPRATERPARELSPPDATGQIAEKAGNTHKSSCWGRMPNASITDGYRLWTSQCTTGPTTPVLRISV